MKKTVTVEELAKEVDNYYDFCEENNILPSASGIKLYLRDTTGLSLSCICDYYYNRDDRYKDYTEIFSRAKLRREEAILRRLAADPKAAQGMMFLLKQPENGGYTDGRSGADSGSATITLKIDGIGGTAAFG